MCLAAFGSVLIGTVLAVSVPSHPPEPSRHKHWPKVRLVHLQKCPVCEACGQRDNINVHHIIPFHLDPSKELDPANLITLCTDGPGNLNCHLVFGHGGDYRCYNPKVKEDVKKFREILSHKTKSLGANK